MQTSSYLEKALFYYQTSAINEYFEKKADQLFEQTKDRSYLEFHVHRPSCRAPDDSSVCHDEPSHMQKWNSDLNSDSESDPSSPIEQYQGPDGPPRYTGAPVERWKIDDVQDLTHHAAVGSSGMCFIVFTLHCT